MDYIIIKYVLDKNNIKVDEHRIYQAAQFKRKMERLNLKENDCTIASIDIKKYFLSCKSSFIKQALE